MTFLAPALQLALLLGIAALLNSCELRAQRVANAIPKNGQKQSQHPLMWAGLKFDHVIGYRFGEDTVSHTLLFAADSLIDIAQLTKSKRKEVVLTKDEIRELIDAAYYDPDGTSDIMECYQPHHIFIFFNLGAPVGAIEVCFLCNNLSTTHDSALPRDPNFTRLAELSKRLGLGAPGYEQGHHHP